MNNPEMGWSKEPIFILGIMPRCGTNFLYDLLIIHPDCASGEAIKEDYLLHYSDLLNQYVDNVFSRWNERWQVPEKVGPPAELTRLLGDTLLDFTFRQLPGDRFDSNGGDDPAGSRHLVTKTPSVRNVHNIFDLFPTARVLILVRDGRSVAESGFRSFGWAVSWTAAEWSRAARSILDFDRDNADRRDRYLIIRYEKLFQDCESELRRIFTFLKLDPETLDYARALDSPVRGSSDLRFRNGKNIHWEPTKKSSDFNPVCRWRKWSLLTHYSFNRIAGRESQELGYDPAPGIRPAWWGDIVLWTWDCIRALKLKLSTRTVRTNRGRA